MRLVFLGNGPFARPALASLLEAGHDLPLVVTRPDRPQGKRLEVIPGPVTALAMERGLQVFQPEDVNSAESIATLAALQPSLLVVADFGQLLSPDCLSTATHGGINIHGSLLPKYRGAAPIAWAIYHGETETGVTIIRMSPRMDAGGMILQGRLPIPLDATCADIEPPLAALGAQLAVEAVSAIEKGTAAVVPQDASAVTKAPKLRKEDGLINWNRAALEIHHQVRAMIPWPVATTFWTNAKGEQVRLQVLRTAVNDPGHPLGEPSARPGTIVGVESHALTVATGNGTLRIERIKPAGKGEMSAGDFARGARVSVGQCFGDAESVDGRQT